MTGLVHFLDVSQWQGSIRWHEVEHPAILKATEGVSFIDPTFERNLVGAIAHGRLLGCYHFLHHATPGAAQAEHYHTTVPGSVGLHVLDWESDPQGNRPTAVQAADFLARLRERRPNDTVWLYGNSWAASYAEQWSLPFWCAWYPSPSGHDTVRDLVRATGAAAWQWTSSARVAGIDTDVDANELLVTIPPNTETPAMNRSDLITHLGLRDPGDDTKPLAVELKDRDGAPGLWPVGDALSHTHENTRRLAHQLDRIEATLRTFTGGAEPAVDRIALVRDLTTAADAGEALAAALRAALSRL